MCGINGIVFSSRSQRTIDARVLERMRDVISYRGPDEAGLFVDGAVGLGHRRLSIVDVASGHQPMTVEDGRLHIIYNGEIYNHADYRAGLEAKGHRYDTHCDTEAILHLYEEHGARCVEYLRGMFAFAIWDSARRELFIARDRLGVKPLYYVHDADGSLYFASEIKALLEAGAVKAEINFGALPDYFANRGTSGDETLFRGVRRLMPGHTLLWRDGELEIRQYWDVHFTPVEPDERRHLRSDAEVIDEWRELFREAVRLRLMADVPLGMFLSGGIDSSAIAAMMSGMVSEPIKTFSVGFVEREANELSYARMVSEAFRTEHHEITISPQQFFGALPRLIWHEDEPLAFDSSVPLYFVSKLAQQHVKVVLTGEGSDELLGGYARYLKTLVNLSLGRNYEALTPSSLRGLVQKQIGYLPLPVRKKLSRTFLSLPSDIESLYFDNFAVYSRAAQAELLTDEAKEAIGELNPYAILQQYLAQTDAQNVLDKLLYADTKTYLHELLMKQDQMSMAASIESRVPFLDHKLVEFTARLPQRFKIRGKRTKWILREAMRGILPDEILTRRKMGFPVPMGRWLREEFRPLVDEYVLHERVFRRGIFSEQAVRSLVNAHASGASDHASRLWQLINFEIWARQFMDGEKLFERNGFKGEG
ncbi:MAG: asparagine synthase (glutamine-hydrolyzing) [Acidobacteria bacterium]|nr:asparagine synthase (glutamine-hydrolyzing) [Acidobacteriota bacterium]